MNICEKLPDKILSWRLKGKGLENFGNNGKPDELPFPSYSEDDLIARVDAVGICFSDVKLIKAGNEHPRIKDRNLKENPVTPGHEVSLTIVGVGENRKNSFKCGQRYIVQADVFYKGKSVAFGYVLPGGYSEYVVIGKEILDGDEGCYLIPVKRTTGFAEVALVEPWACVVAAYQTKRRTEPKREGNILFTGSKTGQLKLNFSGLDNYSFLNIYHKNLNTENKKELSSLAGRNRYKTEEVKDISKISDIDDIIYSGNPEEAEFKKLINSLRPGGIISVHSREHTAKFIPVDLGKSHYQNIRIVGSGTGDILKSYTENTRTALKPGGSAWFIGGAGPMGQMHVIKAAMSKEKPAKILITDLSAQRLKSLKNRIDQIHKKGTINIIYLDTSELEQEEFLSFIEKEFPDGFDDIVSLVPVAPVIASSVPFCADNSVVNIFAGLNIGTFAVFPLELFTDRHVNVIGSSGSPLSAMQDTLKLVENSSLSTNLSLSAVADMYSVAKGVKALIDSTYTGKVVVYPKARNLGILSVKELTKLIPGLEDLCLNKQYWTNEAEKLFLSSKFIKK